MKWYMSATGEPRFFPPPVPARRPLADIRAAQMRAEVPWPLRRIACNSGVVRFVRRRR